MRTLGEILGDADNVVRGIPAAPGLYIGVAHRYAKEAVGARDGDADEPDVEIERFREALAKSKKELGKVFNLAKEKMGETRAAIFEAQLMVLDDAALVETIERRIREEGRRPEVVVESEINKYIEMMNLSAEAYMKERALDIEDIRNRIVRNLQKKRWESKITENVVVVAEHLTPADTILFSRRNVKGYVTDFGGLTSHAAIVARSLDIPAVVGAHGAAERTREGAEVIVDGFHGYLFVDPTDEQRAFFEDKVEKLERLKIELKELRDSPAETTDGKRVELLANVDVSGETALLVANGAEGVGLYRTEQIIEETGVFPEEDRQVEIYAELAARVYPNPITIRAFDLGGDKVRLFHHKEANPFLGLRGVRFLLDNRKLFKTQTRAVLRASVNRNVKYMIPMVSTIEEIRETKRLLAECRRELDEEGTPYDRDLPFGIMVEVPSAALMASDFAKEVDFLSVGTNDLIQYLMAVDRGNDAVYELYMEFHPAVLRTLEHIVRTARPTNTCVSVCGEMAADPMATPFFVGIGMESLSVSPAAIPVIKNVIRHLSHEECRALTDECLALGAEYEVKEVVRKFYEEKIAKHTGENA